LISLLLESIFVTEMQVSIRNIVSASITWVMLILIALSISNSAVYAHAHVLYDGSIITHAHPYNKNQDSEQIKLHKHSLAELLLIDALSFLFFISLSFVFIQNLNECKYLFLAFSFLLVSGNYRGLQGRAPPATLAC
jgi:uncharacterized membrane protein YqhA